MKYPTDTSLEDRCRSIRRICRAGETPIRTPQVAAATASPVTTMTLPQSNEGARAPRTVLASGRGEGRKHSQCSRYQRACLVGQPERELGDPLVHVRLLAGVGQVDLQPAAPPLTVDVRRHVPGQAL